MDASRAEIKIREILEEAGLNFKMEYIFPDLKTHNGRPLRFDFVIFDDDNNELIKTVAILYDVTEELKTQKKYRILNDLNSSINYYFNISGFVINYENDYYTISDNTIKMLHLTKKNPKLLIYDLKVT